ncbi:hypothetical protein BT96DRAFT_1001908 [Gymnopus androsaceus JB14]|uniref:Alpha/beta-hydrolase n=1 Tax=Gymnopus androsaceus JB14 TaxID=1447944 RepID=A0A6A4H0V3_9AGAR|nr:hypothetical protein BT96DRAFT_1001908 [Gymnopus androsaceus JB14]
MAPHIYTPDTYTTPPKLDESKYAAVSWPLYLWMSVKVMFLAPVLATEALLSPFVARSKQKSLKRVIGDTAFRYLTDNLSGAEQQYFMGTSVGIYSSWARKENLPIVIDELEDGGKLLWIGPKRTEKVLLYCHGGAYIVPVQEFTIPFWRYIQLELEKQGIEVGIAIMSYFPRSSLASQPSNPTPPHNRKCQALESPTCRGLCRRQPRCPSPLFNASSTLLSPHHPPGIRLRGAYMMSPWISMTGVGSQAEKGIVPSLNANDHSDIISAKSLLSWGSIVLSGVQTPSDVMYIEPILAPADWYRGLSDVVDRVFVSTGGAECLQDSGRMFFEDKIKPWHGQAEFFEIEGGVHNDPYFDFQVADKPLGERQTLTPKILDWVKKGFEED